MLSIPTLELSLIFNAYAIAVKIFCLERARTFPYSSVDIIQNNTSVRKDDLFLSVRLHLHTLQDIHYQCVDQTL